MNQILLTEKLYVTPELKRKKKFYKAYFFMSIFLVCLLFSYYIYAEYDRNKSEEVSKSILAQAQMGEDHTTASEDSVIRVFLDNPDTVSYTHLDVYKRQVRVKYHLSQEKQQQKMLKMQEQKLEKQRRL